jgi:hypothetical protein
MTSRRWCLMPRCSTASSRMPILARRPEEVEIKLIARLRKHAGNPKFKELGERLEKIREKHEQGLAEQPGVLESDPRDRQGHGGGRKSRSNPAEEKDQGALSALTELFNEVKSKNTHIIVERIVADIDAIVKQVRFDGWQAPPKANARSNRRLSEGLAQIQAAHRSGAFRQSGQVRVHPAVLLTQAESTIGFTGAWDWIDFLGSWRPVATFVRRMRCSSRQTVP